MSLIELSLVGKSRNLQLVNLPLELQPLICSHLSYNDLQALRQTNRFYRSLITINFMRLALTPDGLNAELSTVCRHCLRQEPTGRKLLWSGNELFPEPLTARCESCIVKNRLLTPGDKVYMTKTLEATYICWWCGWPTRDDQQFHVKCRKNYRNVCGIHVILNILQGGLSVSVFQVAMQNFSSQAIVCAPAIVSTFSANKCTIKDRRLPSY